MSKDYTERALAARREQGLPEHVEDEATLDFLADVLSNARWIGRKARPADDERRSSGA